MNTTQPEPRKRPVFVYGTLRPGHHNHARLLAGNTVRELPAHVTRHWLYLQGVPYAVPLGPNEDLHNPPPLIGALITIAPDRYEQVMTSLDALEGYRPNDPDGSHYRRVLVNVTAKSPLNGGGTFDTFYRAWMYIAGPRFNPRTATLIASGDYERAGHTINVRAVPGSRPRHLENHR